MFEQSTFLCTADFRFPSPQPVFRTYHFRGAPPLHPPKRNVCIILCSTSLSPPKTAAPTIIIIHLKFNITLTRRIVSVYRPLGVHFIKYNYRWARPGTAGGDATSMTCTLQFYCKHATLGNIPGRWQKKHISLWFFFFFVFAFSFSNRVSVLLEIQFKLHYTTRTRRL